MSLATALLTPFALLLPVAEAMQWLPEVTPGSSKAERAGPAGGQQGDNSDLVLGTYEPDEHRLSAGNLEVRSFLPQNANQVRIEQSLRIRIAPRGPSSPPRVRPDVLPDVAQRTVSENFVERRMGRCVWVGEIAAVQPDSGNNLILYLHDRRVVRAQLERECRARDFYSGFYLSRSGDGRLCVDRDTLQSRSGANCKLSSMRQLIGLSR